VIPGINLAHQILSMIDYIVHVEGILIKLYPFVQQIEHKLSQDVGRIHKKIDEVSERSKHLNLSEVVNNLVSELQTTIFAKSFKSNALNKCLEIIYLQKHNEADTAFHEQPS
jgi:hypothetical protein